MNAPVGTPLAKADAPDWAPDWAPVMAGEAADRRLRAAAAKLTAGLSPVALASAWQDWALHLAASPARMLSLAETAGMEALRGLSPTPEVETKVDPRFRDPAWRQWPFNAMASNFQACERWWRTATTSVDGVRDQSEKVVEFAARQLLDMASPSNFLATNPQVLTRAVTSGGRSLMQGGVNLADDLTSLMGHPAASPFQIGRDVAATPGQIVARTPLAEIIQYSPTTDKVRAEPVVITPAWIMKYYILDLTAADSLVRALVAEGFTVFMVSWKNPGPEDRERSFDDYRRLGVLAAIDAACAITGSPKVHAAGYCLGGTLLSMTAAAMARDGDDRIASMTLLASQADYTEAGELSLFINESQVALLEDLMGERGYLRPEQMAGTFQVLRANDLIWSRLIHEYLMGEPRQITALDAWSQDATRLPARMESQNLRNLYLDNDLAEGRFCVDGRPIALRDIRAPMFVLATETDHIAPWRSVYKLLLLCETDITFALTNHGHNVGIVAPPGSAGRRHRLRRQRAHGVYESPDAWFAATAPKDGSWWPVWYAWLKKQNGALAAPPPMGRADAGYPALGPAPGDYVLVR